MSDWITDRRPTEADTDSNSMIYITNSDGRVVFCNWGCVTDQPWQPTCRPEPYVPPEPVRRELWVTNNDHHYRADAWVHKQTVETIPQVQGGQVMNYEQRLERHIDQLLEEKKQTEAKHGKLVVAAKAVIAGAPHPNEYFPESVAWQALRAALEDE